MTKKLTARESIYVAVYYTDFEKNGWLGYCKIWKYFRLGDKLTLKKRPEIICRSDAEAYEEVTLSKVHGNQFIYNLVKEEDYLDTHP